MSSIGRVSVNKPRRRIQARRKEGGKKIVKRTNQSGATVELNKARKETDCIVIHPSETIVDMHSGSFIFNVGIILIVLSLLSYAFCYYQNRYYL